MTKLALTALLFLLIAGVGAAASSQVAYHLEFLEVSKAAQKSMGLEALFGKNGQGQTNQFIFEPNVLTLVQDLALAMLRFEERNQQRLQLSQSGIVTVVGYPARMRLCEEEILLVEATRDLLPQVSGLDLSITPLRIEGERVLSQLKFSFLEQAELKTELWLANTTPKLIGIVRQEVTEKKRFLFWQREVKKEARFMAVYLKAEPIGVLSDAHAPLKIGSLKGLSEFLWEQQEEPAAQESQREQSTLTLWFGPQLQLEIDSWFSPESRLNQVFAERRYSFNWEKQILPEGLLLQSQWRHNQNSAPIIGLGIADRLKLAPNLTLSAGFTPLAWRLNQEQIKSFWQAQLDYTGEGTYLKIGYRGDPTGEELSVHLGFALAETRALVLGYQASANKKEYSVGFQLKEW